MNRYPSFLNLSKKELERRIEKAYQKLKKCQICPRKCGVNRLEGQRGFCQILAKPVVSSYHPHFGEERCLVGRHGSGTIFFTHCNLACVYCQNYDISQLGSGSEVEISELAGMMITLQNIGCHNINLVTPTSQVPQILAALSQAIGNGLKVPLVYNTNAYDLVETLKLLDGIVDIYMPDAKYSSDVLAEKYSQAPNYFANMKKNIKEMHRQVGDLVIDENGIAIRGLLVRHLVLPENLAGTKEILNFIVEKISKDTYLNIMDQYHPCYKAREYRELSRRITSREFQEALDLAREAGLRRI